MPNWACTSYVVKGSESEVSALHKIIQDLEAREESYLPNGFGKLWLGNLVSILGGDWEKVYCRGHILDYSLQEDILRMNVESAWDEPSETRHFLQTVFPSLKIIYQTEEPGMCIFQTNDPDGTYFPEKWILDWCDEKKDLYFYEYFEDLSAVVGCLKENGVITQDVEATKEAITAVLEDLQEERPDDISFMFEDFKVLED